VNSVKDLAHLIDEAQSIGALTGAGISTKAGIPDFRGPQGLYVTKQYDPEKVFDVHYFYEDPGPFYEFARDFISLEQKIKPTFAHYFLASLESTGKLKGIITQNIDSLHQSAGSKAVMELHGSFKVSHCVECTKSYSYEVMKVKLEKQDIPMCECGGIIKPDVVFFGENVKYLEDAAELAAQVDLFFVIGTSCVVYPAALIPNYVKGKIVVINMGDVSLNHGSVTLSINEDIDDFFS